MSSPAAWIYGLYLLGLLFPPAAALGLILALHAARHPAAPWLLSHHRFQVRTFWLGLLYLLPVFLLGPTPLGLPAALLWSLWVLVRIGRGWRALRRERPVPAPERWGF